MKRIISLLLVLALCAVCAGCKSAPAQDVPAPATEVNTEQSSEVRTVSPEATIAPEPSDIPEELLEEGSAEEEIMDMEKTLHLTINDTEVRVDWEENESVEALAEFASSEPLTVQMSRYGGFEQVGSLGTGLPRSDSQTTTQAGDIVLYSGNQIVVFYGSNSWAYTRLGRIADKTASELAELLGSSDVTVTLTWE